MNFSYKLISNPILNNNTTFTSMLNIVKTRLNMAITDTTKDDIIFLCIKSVISFFEKYTSTAVFEQEWNLYLEYNNSYNNNDYYAYNNINDFTINKYKIIEFKKKQVLSIMEVKYFPSNSNQLTTLIANTDYEIIIEKENTYAGIQLKKDLCIVNKIDAFIIKANRGFGATTNDIPADLYKAFIDHAIKLYENYGDDCDDCEKQMTPAIKSIYSQYKKLFHF